MRATTPIRLILAAVLVLGSAGAAGAQLTLGGMNVEGEIESGVRFNADDPERKRTQKFEEYRDMGEGLQLDSLRLRLFRPDESYSFELGGSKWGRDDQEFSLSVGQLGLWEFRFDWDQTPHTLSTTARSLAVETSPGVFVLPTARPALVAHNSAPEIDDITVRWDTAKLNLKITPTPDLEIGISYTRIDKDGARPTGVAFGTPGSGFYEIAAPIDERIHDLRLRGVFAREMWQLQASYTLSVFDNGLRRLLVDNPCFGNPAGCFDAAAIPTGQRSVAPSNIAHTVSLAGGVNLPMRTRVNANVSYSLRLQDDSFLPHSNRFTPAGTPALALPAEDLDGRVQVLLGNLSLVTRPLRPWTLTAKYRIYDLIDESAKLIFVNSVENDRVVQTEPRQSGQWGFTKQNFDLDNRFQILRSLAVTVGAGWERWDRGDHREVAESDEVSGKLALDVTPADWLVTKLKYTPSFRRINKYNTRAHVEHSVIEDPATLLQGQSTLLRKFDEAERDRHKIELLLQIMPTDAFTFTPTFAWRYDDFDMGYAPKGVEQLGLLDETSWSAGADLSWAPIERLSFSTGYAYENITQTMRSRSRPVTGASTFDFFNYDWISEQADRVHTVSASLKAALIPKVLDLELGANYSSAYGEVDTSNPLTPTSGTAAQRLTATAKPWPAFQDTLIRLDAALKYTFLKQWTASLRYAFESFEKRDWRTDILNPFMPGANGTVWLGSDTKDYTAHIVGASLSYRFGK